MRFERCARELYARPWALMPSMYSVFHDTFQRAVDGDVLDAQVEVFGMKVEVKLPQDYDTIDNVAVISIDGALGHRLDTFAKACMGAVDYRDITAAIDKANADADVDAIILEINSPGGMVTGLQETAEAIRDSGKPVVSFTDSLCASAGYYLATAADSVFATASADVGCIGTLMTWIDVTDAMEAQGVKRELIASGKFKGMLLPGIPLTDEQREHLQGEVDFLATEFRDFVRESRGEVPQEAMEGQTMLGPVAQKHNLIDEIGGFDAALIEAKQLGDE